MEWDTIISGNIGSGQVGSPHLANAGVLSGALGSGVVSQFHLASGAANSGHVSSGAVLGSLGGGALTIASGTIGPNDLGSGAILSGAIASGQVGSVAIASGAVSSGRLGVTGTPDGTKVLRDDFTWVAPGAPSITSGSVGSGAIASGAVDGFFGTSRRIQSGTVGSFDFGSGAVVAGSVGSGAIVSGNIASGQVGGFAIASGSIVSGMIGNAAIHSGDIGSGAIIGSLGGGQFNIGSGTIGPNDIGSGAILSGAIASGQVGIRHIASGSVTNFALGSGAVTSGRIATLGLPTTTSFLRGDFTWAVPTILSGAVGSGAIASGAVDGFFGTSRRIQSGTVGSFDFGSGAVVAGSVGSGAVVSGNIASGQVGQYHLTSGIVGTAMRQVIDDFSAGGTPLIAAETISGFVAVSITQSGLLQIAMPAVSGRMPAAGVAISGALSGAACSFWTEGFVQASSGMLDFSGFIGRNVYVARSGGFGVLSGGLLSGGFLSGDIALQAGIVANSGTFRINVSAFAKDNVQTPPGTFWIFSGDIASGQIGTAAIASGGVLSGNIASGQIGNFHFASGAVQGSVGAGADNILSGTIGPNDIGSGAILSGAIASGQIGNFHIGSGRVIGTAGPGGSVFNIASGSIGEVDIGPNAVVSGTIASGQVGNNHIASGGVLSGNIASGQLSTNHHASGTIVTYSRNVIDDAFVTVETVSGFKPVCIESGGRLVVAQGASGLRMPAIGVAATNVLSGAAVTVVLYGRLLVTSGMDLIWSGKVGQKLYVSTSGQLVTTVKPVAGLSQLIGIGLSGAMFVHPSYVLQSGQQGIQSGQF